MLDHTDHPIVLDFVEKRPDVQIENPVHFLTRDPDLERVPCILLAAPRPEPIRKTQKILFPYLVENLSHRMLNDFILQRCDSPR